MDTLTESLIFFAGIIGTMYLFSAILRFFLAYVIPFGLLITFWGSIIYFLGPAWTIIALFIFGAWVKRYTQWDQNSKFNDRY